ncbi:MAG TPA: hypothetical protein DEA51_05595 [Erysipelotrichaceae bacterium]|nr:hypothetical protein [Erysipelotrichaceae bacterium]
MSQRFICNETMLGWLANAYTPTPLSMLSAIKKVEQLDDADRDACLEQEIITQDNTITPEVHQVLLQLANATSARRFQMNKFGNTTEKTVYFAQGPGVSVDRMKDHYIIQYPVSLDVTYEDMKEFVGDGQYVDVDVSLQIPQSVISTFICAIDWQRKATLLGIAQDQPATIWFSKEDLLHQMHAISLNQMIHHMDFLQLEVMEIDPEEAVKLNLFVKQNDVYRLSDDVVELGLSMLLLDLVVDLMSVVSLNDQYEISRARVFVFDRHNLLYVENMNESCDISSVSGIEVLGIMKEMLIN